MTQTFSALWRSSGSWHREKQAQPRETSHVNFVYFILTHVKIEYCLWRQHNLDKAKLSRYFLRTHFLQTVLQRKQKLNKETELQTFPSNKRDNFFVLFCFCWWWLVVFLRYEFLRQKCSKSLCSSGCKIQKTKTKPWRWQLNFTGAESNSL